MSLARRQGWGQGLKFGGDGARYENITFTTQLAGVTY